MKVFNTTNEGYKVRIGSELEDGRQVSIELYENGEIEMSVGSEDDYENGNEKEVSTSVDAILSSAE